MPSPSSSRSSVRRMPHASRSNARSKRSSKRASMQTVSGSKLLIGDAAVATIRKRLTKACTLFGTRSALRTLTFARLGQMKNWSDDHVAYLDVDSRRCPRVRSVWAVCRIINVRPTSIRFDRTRHGWHVLCRFRESLTPAELVAFQACAGSDLRREALNLMRARAIRTHAITGFWARRWNILYAHKI